MTKSKTRSSPAKKAPKFTKAPAKKPVLLSGGNPQIAGGSPRRYGGIPL